jgi:hypothetical protein
MNKDKFLKILNVALPLMIVILGCMFLARAYGGEIIVEDKMYIDEKEMSADEDAYYIHTGDNLWISTHSIHKDKQGTYIYRSTIACSTDQTTTNYEKTWKCPYCYRYNPVGKPCDNKDCPSRYR